MNTETNLRDAVERLAEDFASQVDWSTGRNNYGDNEAWESAARQLRGILAEHPAWGDEERGDALTFIRRVVGAWDCCGTCAGGVLAGHDAAVRAAALREAADDSVWDYDGDVSRMAVRYWLAEQSKRVTS